jgi:superfamily II DNA helicase RecQ
VFLTDATIEELARQKPTNPVQLRRIRGIGPAKLEDYGDEILEVIAGAMGS